MSTHLVHILQHNSFLHHDRGCMVLDSPESSHRLPIADILGVVIAARGVSISGSLLSLLLSHGAFVLHCDEKYRPLGKTIPLSHVIQTDLFERQILLFPSSAHALWNKIIEAKISNQAAVLDKIGVSHQLSAYLPPYLPDEGNAARQYWKYYFKQFGRLAPDTRERQGAEDPVNSMLNYGYAVLSAVLHRSICGHGLNPSLGIHHKYRFRSQPLVYDLFEPWRPLVDCCLLHYRCSHKKRELTEWVKFVAQDFMRLRVQLADGRKVKLFVAIDYYVQSFCHALVEQCPKRFFVPHIRDFILEKE